jgi:putative transposase
MDGPADGQLMLREQEGREPSPTAAVVDTQSVRTTEKGAARL